LTRGGSELEIRVHVNERCTDEYGDVPVTLYFAGATAFLHTHIAEHTVQLLNRIIPGSSLVGGTVLSIGGCVGKEIPAYPLVITPVDARDPVGQVTLHRAVALPTGRIAYQPGKERVIPVVFRGLVDPFLEDGHRLVTWSSSKDQTPPEIISSTPQDEETEVSTETSIEIKFSESVGPISSETFIVLDETNNQIVPCCRQWELIPNFVVTLIPESALAHSAVHRVIVAGVADAAGNPMDIRILRFTTEHAE